MNTHVDEKRTLLKAMVRGNYDLQALRIQAGNRIAMNFRAKLGQSPGETEEKLEEEAKKILEVIRAAYDEITEGMIAESKTTIMQKNFKASGVISNYTEFCLVDQWVNLERQETKGFHSLEKTLDGFPIWTEFLIKVKGVGPAMAGVIISEFDIHRARYVSSLWKYAGLDVSGGTGRSRRKEHLVERKYVDKKGEEKTKMSITFNPFLKTKLMGVLASSFLRTGRQYSAAQLEEVKGYTKEELRKWKKNTDPLGAYNSPYAEAYSDYKYRLECHPEHKEKTKGHRHQMAMRRMIKLFLIDLYTNWRAIEGLPVHPPYAEGKLGIVHSKVA